MIGKKNRDALIREIKDFVFENDIKWFPVLQNYARHHRHDWKAVLDSPSGNIVVKKIIRDNRKSIRPPFHI